MARSEAKLEYRRRQRKEQTGNLHLGIHTITRVNKDDLRARLAEVPDDTRGLTAFVFGDPLPGRSSLDQRNSA